MLLVHFENQYTRVSFADLNITKMDDTMHHDENVDELRKRLNHMKRMMSERRMADENYDKRGYSKSCVGVIDGSFLSWVFGMALFVIITVSIYAFYNLYQAILKKFPSHHTEL